MFICSYTAQAKQYCDQQFIDNLKLIAGGIHPVHIVDNTPDDYNEYCLRLLNMIQDTLFNIEHLEVTTEPARTRFLRCVADSANACREEFLKTDEQYFLIIESDVIPPVDIVERLENSIKQLPENWAALGALYYKGFHDFDATGIHQTTHTLSGCTVYSRKFIELFRFEWRTDNMNAFPDAWCGINSESVGMSHYNNHDIRCDHLK